MQVRGSLGPGLTTQLQTTDMEYAWVSQSGRQALAVGPSGIGLIRMDEASIGQWVNVEALIFHKKSRVVVSLAEGPSFDFVLASPGHVAEVLEAIPEVERERLKLGAIPDVDASTKSLSSRPSLVVQNDGSRNKLWSLLWGGFGLQFVGGFILGAAWPSARLDPLSGEWITEGNELAAVSALLLISGGAMLMLVAVIAFGVRYGIRAAEEDRQAV